MHQRLTSRLRSYERESGLFLAIECYRGVFAVHRFPVNDQLPLVGIEDSVVRNPSASVQIGFFREVEGARRVRYFDDQQNIPGTWFHFRAASRFAQNHQVRLRFTCSLSSGATLIGSSLRTHQNPKAAISHS